jgi:hypothetical protein
VVVEVGVDQGSWDSTAGVPSSRIFVRKRVLAMRWRKVLRVEGRTVVEVLLVVEGKRGGDGVFEGGVEATNGDGVLGSLFVEARTQACNSSQSVEDNGRRARVDELK